ncbi:hypothetical protein [Bacteroides sp. 51]|uniref:hypothetical protein n=1 Tax=Bacteroides sp. 51 TaxID=2302938 RepID=UPI0013D1F713|nr:hypothetical protein [Bacteroides sp. 51]NDV83389.1 hypothetical protein [Bacteroides sp. 51]
MEKIKLEMEINLFNKVKGMIKEHAMNIQIHEGQVKTIHESYKPADMIEVIIECSDTSEFNMIVDKAINELDEMN